jgi:hypothetical protein
MDILLLTITALLIYEHPSSFPPYGKIILALLYFAPYYTEASTIMVGVNVTPLAPILALL